MFAAISSTLLTWKRFQWYPVKIAMPWLPSLHIRPFEITLYPWNYAFILEITLLSLKLRFYPWNYAFILEIKLLSLKLRLYPWNYTFILEITLLSLKLRLYPWNYAFILEITQLFPIEITLVSLKLRSYPWNYAYSPFNPLSMFLFPFLPEYVKVMVPQMSLA